ncbi:hypothetical protein DFA_05585 [Cavenderia fasciculata]|uniref:Ubiquitin-conjugating enzyme E2C-binding protein n=1 Tax=Cavenderia fasciculata TaxID=261658 RepID=F4PLN0_CACFS|nr:uncharacterized protein DFA_05585 [Cavenderia fasciculata]EGG23452.1 hypothetical protein DFA_05585 [Cavenderia fasciculata]|eukprot:XP_004361303.1 hypothetical protein DFA_05585 [Cavenderia fasciculata]
MDTNNNTTIKRKQSIYKFTLLCEFMKNLGNINVTIQATCTNSNGNDTTNDKILYSFPASLQERGRLRVIIASSTLVFRPFTKEIDLPSKHLVVAVRDARCIAQNQSIASFNIPYQFTNQDTKLNHLMERDDSTAATNEHQVAILRRKLLQEKIKDNDESVGGGSGRPGGLEITCKTCKSILTNDVSIVKCLPSSNWTEIMDVWLCGCTGVYEFANLPNATQDIQSMTNHCLVGDQYLLIHNDNIISDSIVKDNIDSNNNNQHHKHHGHSHNESTTDTTTTTIDLNSLLKSLDLWKPFECSFCQQDLGVYYQNNYRLYKHSISSIFNHNSNNNNNDILENKNIFEKHTIETLFSTYLLSQSQSSTIYKFLLQSSTTNQIFAQITLLSWDSLLLLDDFNNKQFDTFDKHNYQPIIKVFYKLFTKESPSNKESNMEEFAKCKLLTLSDKECFAILGQLEYSNQTLPFFTKTINDNKIGILNCL